MSSPVYNAIMLDDRDYQTPEERRRLDAEWRNSESGRRFYRSMAHEARKAAVVRTILWVAIVFLVLVVGAAVLKWAIEELAR